jgi:enoyl-CoA hydratase
MTESDRVVRWEKRGHIATVWLSNPARRNAMGRKFFEQLPQVMREASGDHDVRAVVIAAEGPAFTVGLDLADMGATLAPQGSETETRTKLLAEINRLQRSIGSVADCPVPTIVALHGWCIGGGVDLATCCDVRLASADMKLSVRETKIAIVADLGTLQRLPRIVSSGHVAELAFTGKDVSSHRCKEIGLVNDVYETPEAVQAAAHALAQEIAENSPLVVRGVKQVLRYGEGKSVQDGLDYVAAWNAAFLLSQDLAEAMSAFFEKRKAVFRGL